jgi:hypothetical protein
MPDIETLERVSPADSADLVDPASLIDPTSPSQPTKSTKPTDFGEKSFSAHARGTGLGRKNRKGR